MQETAGSFSVARRRRPASTTARIWFPMTGSARFHHWIRPTPPVLTCTPYHLAAVIPDLTKPRRVALHRAGKLVGVARAHSHAWSYALTLRPSSITPWATASPDTSRPASFANTPEGLALPSRSSFTERAKAHTVSGGPSLSSARWHLIVYVRSWARPDSAYCFSFL